MQHYDLKVMISCPEFAKSGRIDLEVNIFIRDFMFFQTLKISLSQLCFRKTLIVGAYIDFIDQYIK